MEAKPRCTVEGCKKLAKHTRGVVIVQKCPAHIREEMRERFFKK